MTFASDVGRQTGITRASAVALKTAPPKLQHGPSRSVAASHT